MHRRTPREGMVRPVLSSRTEECCFFCAGSETRERSLRRLEGRAQFDLPSGGPFRRHLGKLEVSSFILLSL